MSVQMHTLAEKGSYQALAFLLTRDENSPYNDEAMKDPKQQSALEQILHHLIDTGGLLPPEQLVCPNCGCHFPGEHHLNKVQNQDNNNPSLN